MSIRRLPRRTIHLSFRTRHPRPISNVPLLFIALAPFKIKRPRSPSLLCRCFKRLRHNFIAHRFPVPEAGLMSSHPARPAPLFISRKLFTLPLRLHHHSNCLIQQVHWDNRRYGHEFLTQTKTNLFWYRTVENYDLSLAEKEGSEMTFGSLNCFLHLLPIFFLVNSSQSAFESLSLLINMSSET